MKDFRCTGLTHADIQPRERRSGKWNQGLQAVAFVEPSQKLAILLGRDESRSLGRLIAQVNRVRGTSARDPLIRCFNGATLPAEGIFFAVGSRRSARRVAGGRFYSRFPPPFAPPIGHSRVNGLNIGWTDTPGEDHTLVQALRTAEPGAPTALFDRYALDVRRVLLRVLGFDSELQDLIHDVFLRALEGIDQLQDPDRLRSWLARKQTRVHYAP